MESGAAGRSGGRMVVAETWRRQAPYFRSTSSLNSCFRTPSAIFISNLGVHPPPEMALSFHATDLTTGQSHGFKYPFVAKRRLLIWFFGTNGSPGNGRFGTRPFLNLHRPSAFTETCSVSPLLASSERFRKAVPP